MKALSRMLPALLILILCLLLLPAAYADGDVPIDEEHFPDSYFRSIVLRSFDSDEDGSLDDEEIAHVKYITFYDKTFTTMKGLEYFTDLESLQCVKCNLPELDVSKNTMLKRLLCSENNLKELDVSNNNALELLLCDDNCIETLDVSHNPNLYEIFAYNNELKRINLGENAALKKLLCFNNKLKYLDISGCDILLDIVARDYTYDTVKSGYAFTVSGVKMYVDPTKNNTNDIDWLEYALCVDDDVVLYTNPFTPETYTIRYDANGGYNCPEAQIKLQYTELTLDSAIPVRDGYIFRGWAKSADAAAAAYQPGDVCSEDTDLTLFAVWVRDIVDSGSFDRLDWMLDSAGALTISCNSSYRTARMKNLGHNSTEAWKLHKDAIRSVEIGSGVLTVGYYAFEGCSNLASVTLPDGLWEIQYCAFYGCTSLASISLPYDLRVIDSFAFWGCTSLTSFTVPEHLHEISTDAFGNCDGLTAVYVKDLTKWCGISMGNETANPLYYAHNLYLNDELSKDITIPENVKKINSYCFCGCTSITGVTFHDSLQSVGYCAFDGCGSLENIWYEGTEKQWELVSISALNDPLTNARLHTVAPGFILPADLTAVESEAFRGGAFTYVLVPESVETIGPRAFADCPNLRYVELQNPETSIDSAAFEGCGDVTLLGLS